MRQPLCGRENARFLSWLVAGLATCVITLGTLGTAAEARTRTGLPSPAAILRNGGATQPTYGWADFCRRYPGECAVNLSEPATIAMTPQAWQTLTRINRQANGAIKAKTDLAHWGVADRWDFAEDGYGDCEDYQLVKRRRLVAAGFPRRALRMTVVIDEFGEGHAVLMARTDRGDYILDNKRNAVLPWHRTGYTYIKREGDSGSVWASLGGAVASPIATAGR
jgi:predicted transglutaminase-like cysteine proteinase